MIIENILAAADSLITIQTMALMVLGVASGLIAGAIPGFTITMAVVLTLPFTFGMSPIQGLATMIGVFVGGLSGGLMAGIATYIKAKRPDVKIIGVEPRDSAAMSESIAAGKPITLDHVGIFADGVAVKRVGDETFRLCSRFVDEIVTVDTDQICAGIKDIFEDTRSIVEPAGALAVAGVKKLSLIHI